MPSVTVPLGRTGTAPPTWGQRAILRIMRMLGPQVHTSNVGSWALLPEGTDVRAAFDWIAHLIHSYEGMRTRFVPTSDDWVQVLDAGGDFEVGLVAAAPAEAATAAEEERNRLRRDPFRTSEEWAVRFSVVADGDRALAIAWAGSHVVLDLWGVWALDAVAYRPGAVVDPGVQPMDQAAFEESEAGRERDRKAIDYYRQQVAGAVETFPLTDRQPHQGSRFWYAYFESQAMAAALDLHAAAHRTTTGVVLRTAINDALAQISGVSSVTMTIVASNRYTPAARAAIGSFTQVVPTTLRVGDVSWPEMLRRAGIANVRALQRGAYDPRSLDRLEAEMAVAGPGLPDVSMTLNDMRPPTTDTQEPRDLAGLSRGTLKWVDHNDQGDSTIFLWVGNDEDLLGARMMVDTTRLSRDQAEQIFARAEQRLLTEAPDPAVLRTMAVGRSVGV